MSRQIAVIDWCDVCEPQTVRSTHTLLMRPDNELAKEFFVCDAHWDKLVAPDLLPAYETYGVKPDANTAQPTGRAKGTASAATKLKADPGQCPICKQDYNWLSTHVSTAHGIHGDNFLVRTEGGFSCPWCENVLPTAQSLATHTNTAHGQRLKHWQAEQSVASAKKPARKRAAK